MPMYTYWCRQCGMEVEQIVKYEDRDDQSFQHEGPDGCGKERCGGKLERDEGLERTNIGEAAYQMKAILNTGAKVKGHFGKSAPLNRKKKAQ